MTSVSKYSVNCTHQHFNGGKPQQSNLALVVNYYTPLDWPKNKSGQAELNVKVSYGLPG